MPVFLPSARERSWRSSDACQLLLLSYHKTRWKGFTLKYSQMAFLYPCKITVLGIGCAIGYFVYTHTHTTATINGSLPKPSCGATFKYWQLQDQQRELILFPKLQYLSTGVIINTQLHQQIFQLRMRWSYFRYTSENKSRNLRHISEQLSNEWCLKWQLIS